MWDKFTKLLPPWAQATVVITGLTAAWSPIMQWLHVTASAVPPGMLQAVLRALPIVVLTALLLLYMRRCADLRKRVERVENALAEATNTMGELRENIAGLRGSNAALEGQLGATQFIIVSLISVLRQDVAQLGDRLHAQVMERIATMWQRGTSRAPADVIAARDAVLRRFLTALREMRGNG